jgi:hypothetical protein
MKRELWRPIAWLGFFVGLCFLSCSKRDVSPTDPDVPVVNQKPTAVAQPSPSQGYWPLKVTLSGSGTDPDGRVVKYEWDVQGDGVFEISLNTKPDTSYIYSNPGTFSAVLRVTDDDGATGQATATIRVDEHMYPGFADIHLRVGGFWEYSWEYTQITNGTTQPTKSGKTLIGLVDSVQVNFNVIGLVTIFKTSYTGLGDTYPLIWYSFPYIGVKNGVIYVAQKQGTGYGASELFNAQKGTLFKDGFVGYFSDDSKKTFISGSVTNKYWTKTCVTISEPYYKPMCETIAGVTICGDQSHDYQVKEYYIPHVGFGGFYRSGYSVFTGGGYTDTFRSTMIVALTATNM